MALMRCDFPAESLELWTSMTVILPDPGPKRPAEPPVLYLLHGLSDDGTRWVRQSNIERYVEHLGLAVVMPQVDRSYYVDEVYGNRYWTFLSEELPALVHTHFRLSERREDTFVAGLSMGGYGALKWALRHPNQFAAAASLSGALDLSGAFPGGRREMAEPFRRRLFGNAGAAPQRDDPMWLVAQADPGLVPKLYVCCGTEDHLYEENQRFVEVSRQHGMPITYDFGPGDHDWAYWDTKIQDILRWLPLPRST